jgi:hypothetical protein
MPWFAGRRRSRRSLRRAACCCGSPPATSCSTDSASARLVPAGRRGCRIPALMVLALSWCLFVPLAHSLSFARARLGRWLPQFGLGAVGGWFAAVAYIFCLGTMLFLRWRSGAWRRIVLTGLRLRPDSRAPARCPACALARHRSRRRAAIAGGRNALPAPARRDGGARLPESAVSFVVIDAATGREAGHNADTAAQPGLDHQGRDDVRGAGRAGTGLPVAHARWRAATLRGGVLDGDLILQGGGDPYMTLERWWSFVRALRDTGLRSRFAATSSVDDTAFSLPPEDPGAFDGRPNRSTTSQPDALMVNFQSVEFRIMPGPERTPQGRRHADPGPDNLVVDNHIVASSPDAAARRPTAWISTSSGAPGIAWCSPAPSRRTAPRASSRACCCSRPATRTAPSSRYWRALGGEFDGRCASAPRARGCAHWSSSIR